MKHINPIADKVTQQTVKLSVTFSFSIRSLHFNKRKKICFCLFFVLHSYFADFSFQNSFVSCHFSSSLHSVCFCFYFLFRFLAFLKFITLIIVAAGVIHYTFVYRYSIDVYANAIHRA